MPGDKILRSSKPETGKKPLNKNEQFKSAPEFEEDVIVHFLLDLGDDPDKRLMYKAALRLPLACSDNYLVHDLSVLDGQYERLRNQMEEGYQYFASLPEEFRKTQIEEALGNDRRRANAVFKQTLQYTAFKEYEAQISGVSQSLQDTYNRMFATKPQTMPDNLFYDITRSLKPGCIEELKASDKEAAEIELKVPEGFTEDEISVLAFAFFISKKTMEDAFRRIRSAADSTHASSLPPGIKDTALVAQTSFFENTLTNDSRWDQHVLRLELPNVRRKTNEMIEAFAGNDYSGAVTCLREAQKTLLGFVKSSNLDLDVAQFAMQMLSKTTALLSKDVIKEHSAGVRVSAVKEKVDDWIKIRNITQQINLESKKQYLEISRYYKTHFIDSEALPQNDEKFKDMLLDYYSKEAFLEEYKRYAENIKSVKVNVSDGMRDVRNRDFSICEKAVLKDKETFFTEYKAILKNTKGFEEQLSLAYDKTNFFKGGSIFVSNPNLNSFGLVNASINLVEQTTQAEVLNYLGNIEKSDPKIAEFISELKKFSPINGHLLSNDEQPDVFQKRIREYNELLEFLKEHEAIDITVQGKAGADKVNVVESVKAAVERGLKRFENTLQNVEIANGICKKFSIDQGRPRKPVEIEDMRNFYRRLSDRNLSIYQMIILLPDKEKQKAMEEFQKEFTQSTTAFLHDFEDLTAEPTPDKILNIADRYEELLSKADEWRKALGDDYLDWHFEPLRDIINEDFSRQEIIDGFAEYKEYSAKTVNIDDYYKPETAVAFSADANERMVQQAAVLIALNNHSYVKFSPTVENAEELYQKVAKEVLDGTCYSIKYFNQLPDDLRLDTARRALSANKAVAGPAMASADLMYDVEKGAKAFSKVPETTSSSYGAETIEDGMLYQKIVQGDRPQNEVGELYDAIIAADEQSKQISLKIPAALKNTDAAELLVLAEITRPEVMESAYYTSSKYPGTTLPTDLQDAVIGGRTVFLDNTVFNDRRINTHVPRLFLPRARQNANHVMAEYEKGNVEPMAEVLKNAMSDFLKDARTYLKVASPESQFCIQTAKRIKAVLERDEFKPYFKEINGGKELEGDGILSEEEAFWLKKFEMDEEITRELGSLKLEIDSYARTQMNKDPFADPTKDPVYQSMILEHAARQYYLEDKEVYVSNIRDSEMQIDVSNKLAANRGLSRNEQYMLRDKELYIKQLKEVIGKNDEFKTKFNGNSTWIRAVANVEKPADISAASYNDHVDLIDKNAVKVLAHCCDEFSAKNIETEVIDGIRKLPILTSRLPESPTPAQIEKRIGEYNQFREYLLAHPLHSREFAVAIDAVANNVRSCTQRLQTKRDWTATMNNIGKVMSWGGLEKTAQESKAEEERIINETIADVKDNPLEASKKMLDKYMKELMPDSAKKDYTISRIFAEYDDIASYSGSAADNRKMDRLYSLLEIYGKNLTDAMLDDDSVELIERSQAVDTILVYLDDMKDAVPQAPVAEEPELSKLAVKAINQENKRITEEKQKIAEEKQIQNPIKQEAPKEKLKNEKIIENPAEQKLF